MKKTLLILLSATTLGLFGPTASAQLSITAPGAEKLITFETTVPGVVNITTGNLRALMESGSWGATGGGDTGLIADSFAIYRDGIGVENSRAGRVQSSRRRAMDSLQGTR